MSSLKLKHSGGNSVSLNPPSSAPTSSDVAFKLPNADGSANQLLKTDGSGNLGWATDVGGKVKQYKYDQYGPLLETTSTSGSYQDWSNYFSVTITPTSSSNLLVCRFAAEVCVYEQSGSDSFGMIALTDDGASSYLFENDVRVYDYGNSGLFINAPFCMEHVKVAGSTSARTYSIRVKLVNGDKFVINNYGSGPATQNSVLSVMEIEPWE